MALPNTQITPLPNNEPDAVPSLWNSRYIEINQNIDYLDQLIKLTHQGQNRIINGELMVWQRADSFLIDTGTFIYTADRFMAVNQANGQFTSHKTLMKDRNAIRYTVNSPVTDLTDLKFWSGFHYIFEGHHLYDLAVNGKTITISFWFNSNVAGKYPVSLRNVIDTNGNRITSVPSPALTGDAYHTTFDYVVANTPQKVEITIPMPSSYNGGLFNDFNLGFGLAIGFLNQGIHSSNSTELWTVNNYLTTPDSVNWGAVSGNFIEMTALQLEEGDTATPYEPVPYDVQLLRCLRYYEEFNVHFTAHYITSQASGTCVFKVPKRTAPTVTIDAAVNNLGSSFTPGVDEITFNEARLYNASQPATSGKEYKFTGNASSEVFYI